MFYIAGKFNGSGNIVAEGVFGDDVKRFSDHFDDFGYPVYRTLHIDTHIIYSKYFNLRENITKLSFGVNAQKIGTKWGSLLMGGAKKLTKEDYLIIKKRITK